MMGSKKIRTTFALMALATMFAMPSALAGSKKDTKTSDPTQLVWPLPPDKPRFRWVEMFSDAKQFESKKFSFIDRISGDNKSSKDPIFRPIGVATDSKSRVIITGQLNHTVYVIDKEHKQVLRIRGSQTMEFKSPIGVATDDKDNIYVADSKLQSIMRFSPDGTPNASFGQMDGIGNPSYIAFDGQRRRLYITDSHNHQVFVYDPDTLKLITKFGKHGTKKGEFGFPVGIAVNPKTGDIAVSNTQSCSVEVFTPEYKWKQRVGECGNTLGMFTRPKGVAYDQEGNLYVVDNAFNNFQVFDAQGRLRLFVGTAGVGPGNFWMPNAIYIDKTNKVYVSEFYGNRVQVFQFLGSN